MSNARRATQLEQQGQWLEGLRLRLEMVEKLDQAIGRSDGRTDRARLQLSDSLSMLGRYAEARAALEICLTVRTTIFGENHQLVAEVVNRIGESYRREGLLTNALPFYARAQNILAKLPGQEADRAGALSNEGIVFATLGDAAGAERKWNESLGLLAPERHPIPRAMVLTSLGELHRSLGRVQQAVAEHRQALTLLSNLPPHFSNRLLVDNNLASALRDQRQLAEAIPIFENSIRQLSTLRGADDLEVLSMRRNLARALTLDQNHAAALAVTEDVLKRLESTGRREHPLHEALVLDQGDSLQSLGDLVGANQLYEGLLTSLRPGLDADQQRVLDVRQRLAGLALARGDLTQAHDAYTAVLNGRRRAAASDARRAPELAMALLDLATFQRVLGRLDLARGPLEEALALQSRHLSPQHPQVADTSEQLGILAHQAGHSEDAIRFHRSALRIRQVAFGDASPQTALSHLALGELLLAQGKIDEAAEEIASGCAVTDPMAGPDQMVTAMGEFQQANLLHRRGELDRAAPHYDRALQFFERQRARHAIVAARDYALLEVDRSRPQAALERAARLQPRVEALWLDVLRSSSEQDRLSWRGTTEVMPLLAAVAPQDPRPLATAVLRFKGLVLDSLVEDAQLATLSNDASVRADVMALASARRERLRLELSAGGRVPPSTESVTRARAEVERLESLLARRSGALREARRSLSTTIEGVQAALPDGAALVEYVHYRHWLGRGRFEPRFGAILLGRTGSPRWVELGAAEGEEGLGRLITRWQESIRATTPPSNAATTNLLQALHDRLWLPVERALPAGERQIIVSPDAGVSFVPFAALWRDGRFLGEEFLFRYVTSGRDLLTPVRPPSGPRSVCILAEPEYDRPGWQRTATDSVAAAAAALLRVLSLRGGGTNDLPAAYPPLPNARIEGERIAAIARQQRCQPVELHTGTAATKARLRSSGSPYLLHLATHGTFLPDPEPSPVASFPTSPRRSCPAIRWFDPGWRWPAPTKRWTPGGVASRRIRRTTDCSRRRRRRPSICPTPGWSL